MKNTPRYKSHVFFGRKKLRTKKNVRIHNTLQNESPIRKHQNPYTVFDEKANIKKKLEILVLIITVIAFVGLTLYHSFFRITRLDVVGLQRISEEEFDDAVYSIMQYNHFFVIPGNNYFFIDTDEIRDILLEKFPISSIVVQKTFPHTLSITLDEKISTLIYDNGKQYSYVGLDGHVVEIVRNVGEDEWQREYEIVTTTLADGTIREEKTVVSEIHTPPVRTLFSEMGDYPVVYDKRQKATTLNDVVLKESTVAGAISWFHHLNDTVGAQYRHLELENELGDAVIYTREGWYIKVKLNKEQDIQFQALQAVLEERGSREGLGYIDLRYGDRIYWK
ncbi:MAG: hypothetical protein COU33_00320 [Candidatus Magasanikbacteria bacterium CG10_big_fil_rev_8_21_14_0_10_43_6]|uniref:POTRA domain-containing protein n=1 Tax=Candidatus Magasanikbacteria bacterium CG10_big_fil_rev_8_21_14_0_10_43_6 TaxID=1974650 RepID=A0A2M6W2J7_9BACT|nr:MAG: hypothetical protein COU33_00320 [Candidatus Magasanikbacteria bacterium CG10_big_fil_rev_8_21_14_0_10_43_6]